MILPVRSFQLLMTFNWDAWWWCYVTTFLSDEDTPYPLVMHHDHGDDKSVHLLNNGIPFPFAPHTDAA
jgi:hypothetical protein